jgi:hypothetical protein
MPSSIHDLAIVLYDAAPLPVAQLHTTLLRMVGPEMRWTRDGVRHVVQRQGRPGDAGGRRAGADPAGTVRMLARRGSARRGAARPSRRARGGALRPRAEQVAG